MAQLTGKTLGPYRIVEQIGLGGTATVYKAYQPSMDRYVALKVLSTHLSQDPTFVKRFRQEAKVVAKLEHLHILPVYDHGEEDGYLYLVMRFIKAGTLKDRLEAGFLSLGEARHVVNQVGSALEYAHQLGVVHRDLKPSNVLIDTQDDCYLTDFGIAKMVEGTMGLTGSAVLGTPHYMAPEQSQSLEVDQRSDVYAMGVIIYEMVTGQLPFDADTPFAVVMKHITEPLPLPRSIKPDLPESVERVILRALAKDPADRYQRMRDLVTDFDQAVEAVPVEVRTATEPSGAAPTLTAVGEVAAEPTTGVTQPVAAPTWQQWVKTQPLWLLAAAALALVVLVMAGLILSRVPGRVVISGGQVQVVLPTGTETAVAKVSSTPVESVAAAATGTLTPQLAVTPSRAPAGMQTPTRSPAPAFASGGPTASPEVFARASTPIRLTSGSVPSSSTPTNTPIPSTSTATPTPTLTPEPASTPIPTRTPTPTPIPSLSGRVTDAATGRGVAGATVEVWEVGWAGARYWTASATTASDGGYALFGLPSDDYVVCVIATGYAREYYDNVTASHEAEIVQVTALHEASDIDFKLTEGGSISGHIYQSDGVTPVVGAEVFVRPSKYYRDQGFWAKTDADGSYTVENLSLGGYRVTAQAEGYVELIKYYKNSYGWNSASDVVVTPPDGTSGIDINLDRAGSISGFVYASDGITPIPNFVAAVSDTTGRLEFFGTSNSNGSYMVTGIPPGTYTVDISWNIHADTPSWYVGESYDGTVVVSAGNNTPNIDFTLDEGGWITGHVFDEETGEPLEGIDLFECPPDGDCVTVSWPRTSYDGSYRFVVRPGEYLVRTGRESRHLLGHKYVPKWYDNAYDVSDATLVSVTLHHETSGIDLYLAKSGSISGYVYDEGGAPIGDVSVYAFSDAYPGNGANTLFDGSYRIEGLLSGNYVVQVTMSGYVSEYYDDVIDPGLATQVTVIAPDDTPGIDFTLSSVAQ